MTASSPHLAMFGYQRTMSAPAGASDPALVGVDPGGQGHAVGVLPGGHRLSSAAPVRTQTVSAAYERYHTRSAVSAATFDPPPPPPPPALRAQPPPLMSPRPPLMQTTQRAVHGGPPHPLIHCTQQQRVPAQRDEVIYQSVLRTPGSPHQLQQQHPVNNGYCDTPKRAYQLAITSKYHRHQVIDQSWYR